MGLFKFGQPGSECICICFQVQGPGSNFLFRRLLIRRLKCICVVDVICVICKVSSNFHRCVLQIAVFCGIALARLIAIETVTQTIASRVRFCAGA